MRLKGKIAIVTGGLSGLCSDDASYITGHVLPVDGGFLAAGLLPERSEDRVEP